MLECTLTGQLNHRSIGHWVRERHTQFNNINTGIHHGMHQTHSLVGMWITGGNKGNKCLAALSFEGLENPFDSAHACSCRLIRPLITVRYHPTAQWYGYLYRRDRIY